MKIICVDNFNRDYVSDRLIAENVNKWWGEKIVEWLNKSCCHTSEDFFKLVSDDYKLHIWEP